MPKSTSPSSGELRLREPVLPDERRLPKQQVTLENTENMGLKISGLASNDEDDGYDDVDPHGQGKGR